MNFMRLPFGYYRSLVNKAAVCALAFVAVLAVMSCNRSERDWHNAQKVNTVEAYQQFMVKHPQAAQVGEAMVAAETLDWATAKQQGSIAACAGFLAKHPDGLFAGEAKLLVEELEWRGAQTENTAKAYNGYLAMYKDGRFAAEARVATEGLEWEEAKAANNTAAYLAFYRAHPSSDRLVVAQGTVTSAIAYPMGGGTPLLWIEANGVRVDMSPEEAGKLGIITFENNVVATRSGSMPATIVSDKASGKILTIDVNGKP